MCSPNRLISNKSIKAYEQDVQENRLKLNNPGNEEDKEEDQEENKDIYSFSFGV